MKLSGNEEVKTVTKKKPFALVLAIIFLLLISPGLADFKVQKNILSNGLTVLIQEDHALPIVTTAIFYKVGSRNELSGKSGKVHLMEHMMFKGTSKYKKGQISRIILGRGGNFSACTTHDYSSFLISLPSKDLGVALDIEADRMRNCAFDPQELENEKKVIMEERRMDLDSPLLALEEELLKKTFTVHPYRYLVLGEIENIKSFTRNEVINFYNTYYQPNNAILVVIGDIQTASALKQIKDYFAKIPRGLDPPKVTVTEPEQKEERRFEIKHRVTFPVLKIAFHAPPVDTKDSYALSVLDNILTYGQSSRLYKKLILDHPIFNYVATYYHEFFDPYIFTISAELNKGVGRNIAENMLIKEIEELKENPPSENEIEKAKNQIEADFISAQEYMSARAELLGEAEILYGHKQLQRYIREIRSITREDIRRVAQKYFIKEKRTIGWLLPEQVSD